MKMSRLLKWTALAAVTTTVLLIAGVWVASEAQLRRTYAVPAEPPLPDRSDSAGLALGEHLVRSVGSCVLCHGEDLGGAVYIDGGPLGIVTGPNLTRGLGYGAASGHHTTSGRQIGSGPAAGG